MKLKIQFVLLLLFCLAPSARAQTPAFSWVRQIGDSGGFGECLRVHTDATGNVFCTGLVAPPFDMDPGTGIVMVPGAASATQMYFAKYSPSGQLIWVKFWSGQGQVFGMDFCFHSNGTFTLAGFITGMTDLDPGPGTQLVSPQGSTEGVFIHLDGNGNFLWAKHIGGTTVTECRSVRTDNSGALWVSGDFKGTTDFDPGPAVTNLIALGSTNYDPFVMRLDSSGNYLWALRYGSNQTDRVISLELDNAGNILTSGYHGGTGDFDPGAGVSNLPGPGVFVQKLTAAGTLVWARSVAATTAYGMAVDASGNVVLGGDFSGTVDFDPGAGTYLLSSNASSQDAFVLRLNANGNLIWAARLGGPSADALRATVMDAQQDIYLAGIFNDSLDADPGVGNFYLHGSVTDVDVFVVKLDTNASFQWAAGTQSSNLAACRGFSVDDNGAVLVAGSFAGTTDFDPGAGIFNLAYSPPVVSGTAGFTWRLIQCASSTAGTLSQQGCGPLDINGQTYDSSGTYTQLLINSAGCDSLLTLNLSFGVNSEFTLTDTTCENFYLLNGQTYTSSGNYMQSLSNASGCDSTLTLELTMMPLDTSVAQNGSTLTAATGLTYQWLNCNNGFAAVPGETSQSFTPAVSGFYAVEVSNGACTDTSECHTVTILGTEPIVNASGFQVFPNPSAGTFVIQLPDEMNVAEVKILDVTGKTMNTFTFRKGMEISADSWKTGIYFIQVEAGERKETMKWVKQ